VVLRGTRHTERGRKIIWPHPAIYSNDRPPRSFSKDKSNKKLFMRLNWDERSPERTKRYGEVRSSHQNTIVTSKKGTTDFPKTSDSDQAKGREGRYRCSQARFRNLPLKKKSRALDSGFPFSLPKEGPSRGTGGEEIGAYINATESKGLFMCDGRWKLGSVLNKKPCEFPTNVQQRMAVGKKPPLRVTRRRLWREIHSDTYRSADRARESRVVVTE